MTRPLIVHLVDDTTAGGVMRLLEHIQSCPLMAQDARHQLRVVRRGALSVRRIKADVIVSHLTLSWRALPAMISLRALHPGTPLIHVEHSYTQAFTALNVPNRDRFLTMLRIGYALFDHVVAVSQAQGRWMQRRALVTSANLSVIPPMVDLHAFANLHAPTGLPRRIGAIGRLDRQKGFDLLIPAFRALPQEDVQLVFYGDGPERPALEALAQGDARIVFAGHADSPARAMGAVEIVAMPSRWEAYGLVALEARVAGRPVLVSGQDGLDDQVRDGAVLVPNYTVSGWKTALEQALGAPIQAMPRPDPNARQARFAQQWRDVLNGVTDATAPLAQLTAG